MITAITPTGDRHLALSLCSLWMRGQTVCPDQWIVVDDGKEEYRPPQCEYIRREPSPDDPKHTLHVNILTALPYVRGDKIIIIEDDEYYAPNYIQVMSEKLDKYKLVGIGWAKYYHLPSRGYARHANIAHASFAQTAMRSELLDTLAACAKMKNHDYLDVRLWRKFGGNIVVGNGLPVGWENKINKDVCVFDDEPHPLYVGIKGLPGRKGIGVGHRSTTYKQIDKDLSVLKKWIPDDYFYYEDLTSK
jgi:hypothetical protein